MRNVRKIRFKTKSVGEVYEHTVTCVNVNLLCCISSCKKNVTNDKIMGLKHLRSIVLLVF